MDIDIIVPYVDENDAAWQEDFNKYKAKEIKEGIQKRTNTQAFAEERIRDWDAFRYWFRGVEKNCPWVHKVFLVVQRESQIPKWLDRNNPKLRIVLHEEFIPEEFLPTFSTLVIETFYYRIPDLGEHFIVSNDDFYFLNPIPEDLFFKDGKIIQGATKMRKKEWKCGNPDWEAIVNNNNKFLEKNVIKKSVKEFYHYSHLPDGRVKSFETSFMEKHKDEIYKAMKVSKFRHPKNLIPSLLFIDAMKYTKFGELSPRVYEKSKYVTLKANTDFSTCSNCEMICFNDTAAVGKDFETCKNNLCNFLKYKLPDKSSFETDDIIVEPVETKKKLKKCFGIVSWLPDDEKDRKQRIGRLNKTFEQIYDLFGNVEYIIIAQNWNNYKLPDYVAMNTAVYHYEKLGILKARKKLRERFLASDYDYLIMCDDDIVLETNKDFSSTYFFKELDEHPDGYMFLKYGWSLTFCAISKAMYSLEDMVDIDPEKGEGYEDVVFPNLLHYKYPDKEFHIYGINFLQNTTEYRKACASTWDKGVNHAMLKEKSNWYLDRFKQGNFEIDKTCGQHTKDIEKIKKVFAKLPERIIDKIKPKLMEKYNIKEDELK